MITDTTLAILQVLGFLCTPFISLGTLAFVRRFAPNLVKGKKRNEGINRIAPGGFLFGFFAACASAAQASILISALVGLAVIAAVLIGEFLMPVPYIDT